MSSIKENTDITRKLIDSLRESKLRLNEEDVPESVPYTNNDDLFSEIKQITQQQFGADYTGIPTPMLYHPKDGDVTLVGKIQGIGEDMRFQFKYLDGYDNGCKIWCSSVSINNSTLLKIQRIHGVFKNWIDSLNSVEERMPISYRSKTDDGMRNSTPRPGDDRELFQ